MNKGRVKVFLEYVNETLFFVKIWASNIDKVIRHNVVKYVERKKEGRIDLKMRVKIVNILLDRCFVGKPRKNVIASKVIATLLSLSQSNPNLP